MAVERCHDPVHGRHFGGPCTGGDFRRLALGCTTFSATTLTGGHIGSLHFTFFDQDRGIRSALKQARAASLISGKTITDFVIFQEEGVRIFSAEIASMATLAKAASRFCGVRFTEKNQSGNLKKWAVPSLDADFFLNGTPM